MLDIVHDAVSSVPDFDFVWTFLIVFDIIIQVSKNQLKVCFNHVISIINSNHFKSFSVANILRINR